MKETFILLVFAANLSTICVAQRPWNDHDTTPNGHMAGNNYSTTYLGNIDHSIPIIVAAIPHNGWQSGFDNLNAPLDLSFDGSLFNYKSNLSSNSRRLYTYDSSEVYFLTPGIYLNNAAQYQYRVSLNATTVITPWSSVSEFTHLALNTFRRGFGSIGGYKTTWGNFIIVELKRKGSDTAFCNAVVYWKEVKPQLMSVYTSGDMNEFLSQLARPWDRPKTNRPIPATLVLKPTENNIVFYLTADVNKKAALEYELFKSNDIYTAWKANDFDNNFIWLRNLPPGNYTINMRFAKQRHNISSYAFEILPFWYQTTRFKILLDALLGCIVGIIVVLFWVLRQKKKRLAEQLRKEKTNLELKAIRSQLNPHFVFNALGSIQGLINKNDMDSANKYLTDFANLMRDTLVGTNKETNSIDQEVKVIERYLQLEQLRFHFNYTIRIGESINVSATEVPSLLLQPLVENAVKHGVSGMQEKGLVDIAFEQTGKDMLISVRDNGKGFDIQHINSGYGLKLTTGRIRLLNEMSKNESVSIDIQATGGTTVHLVFQNWFA